MNLQGYILTFAGALGLWVIQTIWASRKEKQRLQYTYEESERFPIGDGNREAKTVNITLKNSGNTPIEKIDFEIKYPGQEVLARQISDEGLLENPIFHENHSSSVVTLLNPGEKLTIKATVTGYGLYEEGNVRARAVGVTATPRKTKTRDQWIKTIGDIVFYFAIPFIAIREPLKIDFARLDF